MEQRSVDAHVRLRLSSPIFSRRIFLTGLTTLSAALVTGCGDDPGLSTAIPSTEFPTIIPADLNHITITGQSISVGAEASPILSTIAPFLTNKRIGISVNSQVLESTGLTLQPLAEGLPEDSTQAFSGDGLETCGTSFGANLAVSTSSHPVLVSGSGVSGLEYADLCGPMDWTSQDIFGSTIPTLTNGVNAGSPSFREMVAQITLAKKLAPTTYAHRAILLVHGETDAFHVENTNYAANLATWQADIESASNRITGASAVIPMIMSQCIYSLTGLQQLQQALNAPTTHTLACPEYNIPHQSDAQIAGGANQLHLTNYGQRILGAYFAKAYAKRVLQAQKFLPTYPINLSVNGHALVVDYYVPVPPLVLDTTLVKDPGNYGFEFVNSVGITITAVAVTGPRQITISLNGAPAPGSFLNYATQTLLATQSPAYGELGPTYGPRGCVRDSDLAVSYYPDATGNPTALYNYSVAASILV